MPKSPLKITKTVFSFTEGGNLLRLFGTLEAPLPEGAPLTLHFSLNGAPEPPCPLLPEAVTAAPDGHSFTCALENIAFPLPLSELDGVEVALSVGDALPCPPMPVLLHTCLQFSGQYNGEQLTLRWQTGGHNFRGRLHLEFYDGGELSCAVAPGVRGLRLPMPREVYAGHQKLWARIHTFLGDSCIGPTSEEIRLSLWNVALLSAGILGDQVEAYVQIGDAIPPPDTDSPLEALSDNAAPPTSLESDPTPEGAAPPDSLESDPAPEGTAPLDSLESDSTPEGTAPLDSLESDSPPAGAAPPGSLESDSPPAGTAPLDSLESDSPPASAAPPKPAPNNTTPPAVTDSPALAGEPPQPLGALFAVLLREGVQVAKSELSVQPGGFLPGGRYRLLWGFPGFSAAELARCTLAVFHASADGRLTNETLCGDNTVPLCRPTTPRLTLHHGGQATLSFASDALTHQYLLQIGEQTTLLDGREAFVPDASAVLGLPAWVAPCYLREGRLLEGPPSPVRTLFTPGFYPTAEADTLLWGYCGSDPKETALTLPLPHLELERPLTQPITAGPLRLFLEGEQFYLSICRERLTSLSLTLLFPRLFALGITQNSFFMLRDRIARLALYAPADALEITYFAPVGEWVPEGLLLLLQREQAALQAKRQYPTAPGLYAPPPSDALTLLLEGAPLFVATGTRLSEVSTLLGGAPLTLSRCPGLPDEAPQPVFLELAQTGGRDLLLLPGDRLSMGNSVL